MEIMEEHAHRLKRLKIRSWRRGTKEMDLFFGRYADAYLAEMDHKDLSAYEALLAEEDPKITAWVTGTTETPTEHAALVSIMTEFAKQQVI